MLAGCSRCAWLRQHFLFLLVTGISKTKSADSAFFIATRKGATVSGDLTIGKKSVLLLSPYSSCSTNCLKGIPSWKSPICLIIFEKGFLENSRNLFGKHIKPPGKIKKNVHLNETTDIFKNFSVASESMDTKIERRPLTIRVFYKRRYLALVGILVNYGDKGCLFTSYDVCVKLKEPVLFIPF